MFEAFKENEVCILKINDSMMRFGVLICVCDVKPHDRGDYVVVNLLEDFRLRGQFVLVGLEFVGQ